MDYKDIKEIIKNVNESELTFLELKTDDVYIKMQKGDVVSNEATSNKEINLNTEHFKQESTNISEVKDNTSKEEKVVEDIKKDEKSLFIKSPIVGTFYASSSPDEEAFVSIGSKVKVGDVVCIIEAMKLMNEIESDDNYEIVEILVENEQMVEYGQPLFRVRK